MRRVVTVDVGPVYDVLAVDRLVRLVTADRLTLGPRAAVIRWAYRHRDRYPLQAAPQPRDGYPEDWVHRVALDPDPPLLAYGVTCRWCASMWAATAAAVVSAAVPGVWRHARRVLAVSDVVGAFLPS